MFTDSISAQPEIMDDYETAVHWLNSVASHYPNISACYMANPYAQIPVIMNTGWMPGEDERPETRPWYRETERAASHFNISAPYFDAQTGNYCVTFSRVVYGENNEFLGIFGIDFFLDKLMQVLGESYTSRSYAFLVDSDGVIIAGHTRRLAALKLELQQVPVIVCDDLTEQQVKALRLADNKTAEFSEWDADVLDAELLEVTDLDMQAFGFDAPVEPTEVKEDDFEEEAEDIQAKCQTGEIWVLGNHRLMCGDTANPDDMSALMGG